MKTLKELKAFAVGYVYSRYPKKELDEQFSAFFGFKVEFEESTYESFDYCMILNLDLEDKDLYLDLWYLVDRTDQMFITEISFDSDYILNMKDDNKKIIGVSKWEK